MEYPKIETLYTRDEVTHKVTNELRLIEFRHVSPWLVTEKIDGTNVRIKLEPGGPAEDGGEDIGPTVTFGGRTDSSQMPTFLIDYLLKTFDQNVVEAFDEGTEAILFGEGYGPKIQKGGGNYRDDVAFRLYDVVVLGKEGHSWWLSWDNVVDVARKLGIKTVPVLGNLAYMDVTRMVAEGFKSHVAIEDKDTELAGVLAEGVVCRTDPLLFTGGDTGWYGNSRRRISRDRALHSTARGPIQDVCWGPSLAMEGQVAWWRAWCSEALQPDES